MYQFFKSDLDALIQKRDLLAEQVRDAGQLVGETTRQSSETWHDNAPYDIAKQEFEHLLRQHAVLDEIAKQAQIIEPPRGFLDCVSIGAKVRYKNDLEEVRELKIGSYVPTEGSGVVSYNAPLAQILMGNKIGDIATGVINNRSVAYEIVDITTFH